MPITMEKSTLDWNLTYELELYSHDHDAYMMVHRSELEELVLESKKRHELFSKRNKIYSGSTASDNTTTVDKQLEAKGEAEEKLAMYYQHSMQRINLRDQLVVMYNDQKERFQPKNLTEIDEASRKLVNMDFRHMGRDEAIRRSREALWEIEQAILNPVKVVRRKLYYFLVFDDSLKTFDAAKLNIAHNSHSTLDHAILSAAPELQHDWSWVSKIKQKCYWPALDYSHLWTTEEDLSLVSTLKQQAQEFTVEIKFSIISAKTYHWYTLLKQVMAYEFSTFFDNLSNNTIKLLILEERTLELGLSLLLIALHLIAKLVNLRVGRFLCNNRIDILPALRLQSQPGLETPVVHTVQLVCGCLLPPHQR